MSGRPHFPDLLGRRELLNPGATAHKAGPSIEERLAALERGAVARPPKGTANGCQATSDTTQTGGVAWATTDEPANLTLNAGFSAYGAGFGQPQYTIMPDGLVVLRGLVVGAAGRAGNVIGTLPEGYRPSTPHRIFSVPCAVAGSPTSGHLYVNTDGTLGLDATLTPTGTALTWVSVSVAFYP